MRLDNYLVENNFFITSSKAQIAIKNSNVFVNNKGITKNSFQNALLKTRLYNQIYN